MTKPAAHSGAMRLSIVIPVFNEAENVLRLLDEVRAAVGGLGLTEVIFVDDGSSDSTVGRLATAPGGGVVVRVVRHLRRAGQSAAVRTGVKAARGFWVATLDGDGQNDPADLPSLMAMAESEGLALVGGVRARRHDSLSKRLASRFANTVRQTLLHDGAVDSGCGIKLFRRDVFLELPFFGAMHRFLPALFQIYGHRVGYVAVNHRPRHAGVSKYVNWRRGVVGLFDVFGVLWLKCRTPSPPPTAEP